ncbi:MAG: hypothetical protein ACHQ9S_19390 [Candidatus Binatia bacterium]
MNDPNQRVSAEELCGVCGEPLGDEEWYFGRICPEYVFEAYAHARCV